MSPADEASRELLALTRNALAAADAPISSGTAAAAITAIAAVVRGRRAPISAQTRDSLFALIRHVEADIAASDA